MKVLFVGLGSIGTRHLKNLYTVAAEKGISVVTEALRHGDSPLPEETAALVSRQHHDVNTLDSHYDIIFITNPTILHYEVLSQLRDRAGCFFIEKPIFETSKKKAEDIGLLSKKAYIAAPMRWCKTYMELKKCLPQREVYSARAICSSYLPEWRKGVDYRKVYSARKELGGGVTIDLIHEWDYLVDLFGYPQQCCGFSGQYSNLQISSDDISIYIARYPKLLCEVHLDYFGRGYRRTLELLCAAGQLTADFGAGTLTLEDGTVVDCSEPVNERYLREMRYFFEYACDESIRESINTPQQAWQVLKLVLGE